MKGTDIYPAQVPLMSKEGARLAERSGAMVPWNKIIITNAALDGDPWKTVWSTLKPGDRPTLADWLLDAPADYDRDPDDPGSQSEQESRHNNADDEDGEEESEENESHRHEDLRRKAVSRSEKSEGMQLDRSIAQDAGKCKECQLPEMPRRGYSTFDGQIV